ncbi:hypothetical protein BH18CHL1_BH18CHL1_00480 [soil metagenome]
MDPDEIIRAGPTLDRQERGVRLDVRGRPVVPSRVPETRPTPLGDHFIELSIVVLVCGVVAISALSFGASSIDPVVRFPLLIGGAVLAVITVDAIVRIWRSAWAWLPVDRARGLFRFLWAAVLGASLVLLGALFVLLIGV